MSNTVETAAQSPGPVTSHPAPPWLLRAAPTGLVILALAGIAFWGHHTGWRFRAHVPSHAINAEGLGGVARVEFTTGQPGTSPLDRGVRITFESAESAERVGIDVSPVSTEAMTEAVVANGELALDPTLVSRPSSRAAGTVWKVTKAAGQVIRSGELLAVIDAAEVGRAKSELLQALVQVRLRTRTASNLRTAGTAVPERQRVEAETAVREAEVRLTAAEQALVNLGLPVPPDGYRDAPLPDVSRQLRILGLGDVAGLNPEKLSTNLLPVRSTLSGVILSADVGAGESVDAGRPLFTVADPIRLWLTMHVSADDMQRVRPGQTVTFRPDGISNDVAGKLNWVGTEADGTTRTVPVRAELANPDGRLRAATLGRGRIIIREEPKALVVPNQAVREFRGTSLVFVRAPDYLKPGAAKAFAPRAVRVGTRDEKNTEIVSGLRSDEVVVTKGSDLLLHELNRSAPAGTVKHEVTP